MTADVSQYSGGPAGAVDADAVCGVCGIVNTDGTLLCRGCGNNLRDQKLRRLQAEVPADMDSGVSTRMIVRGVFGVVGLLLLLIVALNVESIADSMVGGGNANDPVARFFKGPDSVTYEALSTAASGLAATPDTIAAALDSPPAAGVVDGEYIIVDANPYGASEILGTASVVSEGDVRRFAVRLSNGYELRGFGHSQGTKAFRCDWEDMALRTPEGAIVSASGVAVRQTDGGLECFGQSELDELSYGAVAYRVP
ncbi:MAG: hypothetical protein GC168_08675 [Candidatus Hydrogenedens sp.]|nr:hypothetical protein [Candidatus Hydrogenedens sp.]